MSPDDLLWARWDEVDRLLAVALDQPQSQRAAFVEREAADPQLRGLVLKLLDRVATDGGHLTRPSPAFVEAAFGGTPPVADADLLAGTTVGRYVIVRRRARGGMATVYEADRADGTYTQRVALKVLRRGLDTEDFIRRFVTERQILSSLAHPNIARLLDGGSTADGRPWLAMELIEGEPITSHADSRHLGVNARLDLFLQVADAVHAAHRQLVVHRDIKPSNILVTADGRVKLLDFGIAKLLAEESEQTQAGARALTPDYASPEQLLGGRITTATDVYQLGLLLAELLTGLRPTAAWRDTPLPLRASRLANRSRNDAPNVEDRARARATSPPRLARELSGDLDVIVAKALRREPEQRFASVDELASDIRRHLRGLPIAAFPESRAYRFRKLVGRNRWAATAVGVAVIALAAYASTVTLQSRRIAAERDRAEQEAAKAAEVTDFLVQLFNSADPNRSQGAQVTARELLDRGVRDLENGLDGDPARRAAMLSAIGRSYYQLAMYPQARAVLEKAVAARRSVRPPASREVASDLNELAPIVGRTDPDSGLRLFAEALDLAEETVGKSSPLVGKILTGYAVAMSRRYHGDPRTDSMMSRAVAILRSAPGDNRTALAQALNAAAYGKEPEMALPLMREGLAINRSLHGELHAATAMNLSDLALAMEPVDPLGADTLMLQALAISAQLHGKRHALTLAMMNNLAGLRRDRSAWSEAAPLYREVLALRRELYPNEFRGHAYALYGLGLTLAESGDSVEAERHLREALRILEASERPGSILLPLTRAAIGYALARQRRFAEAEPMLVDAVRELKESRIGAMDRARTLERVIWMYETWGRSDQAAGYQERLDQLLIAERSGQGSGQ